MAGGMSDDEFAAYYDRGKVRQRGNLKRRPRRIPPYDLKSTTIRDIWRRVRAEVGEPTPRVRDAVVTIMFRMHWGELVTPTELNRSLGLKKGGNTNHLGGDLARLRRIVFEEAGAVQDDYGARWHWPGMAP